VKAGARSPAMVAQKRLDSLLDSPGYVQGVATSVFQAVVDTVFDANMAYGSLGVLVCECLFTADRPRSLRAFAQEALAAPTATPSEVLKSPRTRVLYK
jgi:hypothetical protein